MPSARPSVSEAANYEKILEASMLEYAKKKYPWNQCIKDQKEDGHDEETAKKICGKIKAKSQG